MATDVNSRRPEKPSSPNIWMSDRFLGREASAEQRQKIDDSKTMQHNRVHVQNHSVFDYPPKIECNVWGCGARASTLLQMNEKTGDESALKHASSSDTWNSGSKCGEESDDAGGLIAAAKVHAKFGDDGEEKRQITWPTLKDMAMRTFETSKSEGGEVSSISHILQSILETHRVVVDVSPEDSVVVGMSEPSIGSFMHEQGLCKPCVFANKTTKICRNGPLCLYCHHFHQREKRNRKRKSGGGGCSEQASGEICLLAHVPPPPPPGASKGPSLKGMTRPLSAQAKPFSPGEMVTPPRSFLGVDFNDPSFDDLLEEKVGAKVSSGYDQFAPSSKRKPTNNCLNNPKQVVPGMMSGLCSPEVDQAHAWALRHLNSLDTNEEDDLLEGLAPASFLELQNSETFSSLCGGEWPLAPGTSQDASCLDELPRKQHPLVAFRGSPGASMMSTPSLETNISLCSRVTPSFEDLEPSPFSLRPASSNFSSREPPAYRRRSCGGVPRGRGEDASLDGVPLTAAAGSPAAVLDLCTQLLSLLSLQLRSLE